MPDILTGPYALTAKGSFQLSDIFTTSNVDIVYEAWGQYRSWAPGRAINAFTTTEQDKGYIVYSKVQQNLDTYFGAVSPVSEAQSLINSSLMAAIRDAATLTSQNTADNGSILADIADTLASSSQGGDASAANQLQEITALNAILTSRTDGTSKTQLVPGLTKLGVVYSIPSPEVLSGSNRLNRSFLSAANTNRTLWQGGGVNINVLRLINFGSAGTIYMRLYNVSVDAAIDYTTINPVCVLAAAPGQKDEIFGGTGLIFGTGLTVMVTKTLDFTVATPSPVGLNECYCFVNYTSTSTRLNP